jgi:hypothetical protein
MDGKSIKNDAKQEKSKRDCFKFSLRPQCSYLPVTVVHTSASPTTACHDCRLLPHGTPFARTISRMSLIKGLLPKQNDFASCHTRLTSASNSHSVARAYVNIAHTGINYFQLNFQLDL